MEKNESTNGILIKLSLIAFALMLISIILLASEKIPTWQEELAKALMGLAITVVAGGFIKFLFDEYQQKEEAKKKKRDWEAEEKRKLKDKEDELKQVQKHFKEDMLNQLRKVFDIVDESRLLIEAHKSAKTYGEKMQANIIPAVVSLFDLKRSLVDSLQMMWTVELKSLRVNTHYMIAYLQALVNEYKTHYATISNCQFFEEEMKKKVREKFISNFQQEYAGENNIKEKIPKRPDWAWKEINQLPVISDFLNDDYTSLYPKMFVDFYEWSKKILKGQTMKKLPGLYDKKYADQIDIIDKKKEDDTITKSDSLVDQLIREKMIPVTLKNASV